MNKRFPFPKRYWLYLFAAIFCACLLFINFFRTDSLTGDIPFSEYTQKEWKLVLVFIVEEIIIFFGMFVFAWLGNRIVRKRDQEIIADCEKNRFAGIKPNEYDYVWFDFSSCERALIVKKDGNYVLDVHEYDSHCGKWVDLNETSIHSSLKEIKESLFYDFDFYCEENAQLDKSGEVIYRELNANRKIVANSRSELWARAVEMLYDKELDGFCGEVVKVIYSKEKSMRYVILKKENDIFTYELQMIYLYDDEEQEYICMQDGTLPAMWEP